MLCDLQARPTIVFSKKFYTHPSISRSTKHPAWWLIICQVVSNITALSQERAGRMPLQTSEAAVFASTLSSSKFLFFSRCAAPKPCTLPLSSLLPLLLPPATFCPLQADSPHLLRILPQFSRRQPLTANLSCPRLLMNHSLVLLILFACPFPVRLPAHEEGWC